MSVDNVSVCQHAKYEAVIDAFIEYDHCFFLLCSVTPVRSVLSAFISYLFHQIWISQFYSDENVSTLCTYIIYLLYKCTVMTDYYTPSLSSVD